MNLYVISDEEILLMIDLLEKTWMNVDGELNNQQNTARKLTELLIDVHTSHSQFLVGGEPYQKRQIVQI